MKFLLSVLDQIALGLEKCGSKDRNLQVSDLLSWEQRRILMPQLPRS